MTHGSLFSGIGGAELAAQWAGWENLFHCEINPFGRKVLDYYWPKAKSYADIKQTDFSIWRNRIDVLTGGFPCQPFSAAGKRKGTEDDRHLWPEMLRAIQEIQPRYIVGENVRGFTNWNGGLVFNQVLSDLENEGYEVTPFLLPACGVNAPHRRDRIWIIAFNSKFKSNGGHNTRTSSRERMEMGGNELGQTGRNESSDNHQSSDSNGATANTTNDNRRSAQSDRDETGQYIFGEPAGFGIQRIASDTDKRSAGSSGKSRETESQWGKNDYIEKLRGKSTQQHIGRGEFLWPTSDKSSEGLEGLLRRSDETRQCLQEKSKPIDSIDSWAPTWDNFPTQSPVCSGNDGLPTELDGITFPKWRNESIKGFGNAWVPELAYEIFKVINQLKNQ